MAHPAHRRLQPQRHRYRADLSSDTTTRKQTEASHHCAFNPASTASPKILTEPINESSRGVCETQITSERSVPPSLPRHRSPLRHPFLAALIAALCSGLIVSGWLNQSQQSPLRTHAAAQLHAARPGHSAPQCAFSRRLSPAPSPTHDSTPLSNRFLWRARSPMRRRSAACSPPPQPPTPCCSPSRLLAPAQSSNPSMKTSPTSSPSRPLQATLTAPTELGAMHGLETFLQLVSMDSGASCHGPRHLH